ncbi:ATP-binding protein [Actinoplanes sp. LDG1-06]|uniref:histidine kinase n=1 Tax=Paractinoplanes ovalisporus TaxID=2810368 RepID=A0ABS2AG14_9ACTN|nr:ATP-binding protein [Actinoplanes ovalisporus]MBM2618778.1 ATP-binding protein [Actinoplanes ovalisporus]
MDLLRGVDLHQRIQAITTGVILLSRVGTLVMVGLSIVALARLDGYTNKPLATATYLTVAVWSVVFLPVVARRDPIPRPVLAIDVAVTSAAAAVLPWSLTEEAFATAAVPDFEPVGVSTAVAVALATASWWATAAGGLALAVAYFVAQLASPAYFEVASTANIIGWQVVTAACCCLFIRRLRAVADAVDLATDQVIAARERVAARRSQDEERMRHFQEQLLRHRALHDGPLRLLTAIAGQGPAGHPDPRVRGQAAISANVLRGTTPDDPDGTLTELSLALIEAGNDSAAQGLRVEYHFANLPDTLPSEVLHAFRQAAAEALANVARHAGSSRVRLTALSDRQAVPTVTVAVVDQGKGFDPETTPFGYGIRHSITARMHEVGGAAGVDSHPGQGTRVDLRWPA